MTPADRRTWVGLAAAVAAVAVATVALVLLGRGGGAGRDGPGSEAAPPAIRLSPASASDEAPSAFAFAPRRFAAAIWRLADPAATASLRGSAVDSAGTPVADAAVTVNALPRRTTRTGPNGGFEIGGLMPGQLYWIEGATPGAWGATQARAGGEDTQLLLEPAAPVHGVVRGSDGAAVAGARVVLLTAGGGEILTETDGRFAFDAAPDRYAVLVSAPGFVPRVLRSAATGAPLEIALSPASRVSGTVTAADGRPVTGARVVPLPHLRDLFVLDLHRAGVVTDGAGGFHVWAEPGTPLLVLHDRHPPSVFTVPTDGASVEALLPPAAVVTGRVVFGADEPAAFAVVRAAPDLPAYGAWPVIETHSDADGRFELPGLWRQPVLLAVHSADSVVRPVRFDAGSPSTEVVLEAKPSATMTGRVFHSDGTPVRAFVNAYPTEPFGAPEAVGLLHRARPILSNRDGRFTVHGLLAGRYRLDVLRPAELTGDYPTGAHVASVEASTGDSAISISVPASGSLRGTIVLDDDWRPAGLQVRWGDHARIDIAGADRRFVVDGLPPGTQRLSVLFGGIDDVHFVDQVTVTAGKVTDVGAVELARGRDVAGRVVDARGKPVPNARVLAFSERRNVSAGADGAGRFTLRAVPAGAATAVAHRLPDPWLSDVTAIPAGEGPLILTVQPPGRVKGVVRAESTATPLEIRLNDDVPGVRVSRTVTAATDGTFLIDNLPAAPYNVTVAAGGVVRELSRIQVRPGKTETLEVDVAAPGGADSPR